MSDDRDDVERDDKKVGGADNPVVPTGKAGRGNVAERRVRTDGDDAEDTTVKRANPVQYVGQVGSELKKVIWPTRSQMVTYTAVVLLFLVFMTLLVSGVDFGMGKGIEWAFAR
ncbi:preprotein translocase subunit SecE [Dietzia timorensis]|uniref:Protein translocase subunit SecE n=1 Tax=Dietzia timorensis TaxID=499555 RepID=A0A173LNP4_9ACTN|nr:preprotein translocase subunit SecE [Dietzia timorensis]ANI93269.1 putative preprotein translocase subunit SecE [Dietzia timorensis]